MKAETAARAEVIRVLLVDDHSVVRQGLRLIIEEHAGLQVVGEEKNRSETIAIAEREHPDVVLLDLDLGDESGLGFIPEILSATAGKAKVLLLTGVRDGESIYGRLCDWEGVLKAASGNTATIVEYVGSYKTFTEVTTANGDFIQAANGKVAWTSNPKGQC